MRPHSPQPVTGGGIHAPPPCWTGGGGSGPAGLAGTFSPARSGESSVETFLNRGNWLRTRRHLSTIWKVRGPLLLDCEAISHMDAWAAPISRFEMRRRELRMVPPMPGCYPLDATLWMPPLGCYPLDATLWMLPFGCYPLDATLWMLPPRIWSGPRI